jgi:hypothetical protein
MRGTSTGSSLQKKKELLLFVGWILGYAQQLSCSFGAEWQVLWP